MKKENIHMKKPLTKNHIPGLTAIAIISLVLASSVLCACTSSETPETPGATDEPVEGGTITDKADPNAPKEIKSDSIVSFYTNISLPDRWKGDRDERGAHDFEFEIKQDEGNVLTAYEHISGVSLPADDELLKSLQKVIKDHDLVSRNGRYRITAGIDPEYGSPCEFTVIYDTGEKLSFTVDNEPYSEWECDIYDVFAKWFSDNGIDSLYPGKYTATAKRFSITVIEDGNELCDFSTALKNTDGEYVYTLPDDYYANLTTILSKYDLTLKYDYSRYNYSSGVYDNHENGYFGFGESKPDYSETDSEKDYVDIYVEYDDGDRFSIETKKKSEIAAMQPMLDELIGYHSGIHRTDGKS